MSEYKDYGFSGNKIHSHSYLVPSILKMLDKKVNSKILDVGCGDGSIARVLIEAGFDVYGIDASEQGIKIAKSNYPDRFFLQDLSKDSLTGELSHIKFDTVISTEVIEHLYNPRKYMDFCRRVLLDSGGGQIIISTPYNGYLKNLIISIFDKWDLHLNPLWDGGHIKFWSKATLFKLFDEYGFRKTQFIGSGRIPFVWKSMFVKAEI